LLTSTLRLAGLSSSVLSATQLLTLLGSLLSLLRA
jgi:hypothetical protein